MTFCKCGHIKAVHDMKDLQNCTVEGCECEQFERGQAPTSKKRKEMIQMQKEREVEEEQNYYQAVLWKCRACGNVQIEEIGWLMEEKPIECLNCGRVIRYEI